MATLFFSSLFQKNSYVLFSDLILYDMIYRVVYFIYLRSLGGGELRATQKCCKVLPRTIWFSKKTSISS